VWLVVSRKRKETTTTERVNIMIVKTEGCLHYL